MLDNRVPNITITTVALVTNTVDISNTEDNAVTVAIVFVTTSDTLSISHLGP